MTESSGYALIGYAVRFPGATDAGEFWTLLADGREAISEVPAERWDVDAFYDPDPDAPGKMVARRAGFVDDVAGFDAPFFSISAREAEFMDPQHRMLLETTWSAVEHAGIAPSSLSGTDTGVFMGLSTHEFGGMLVRLCEIEDIDIYSGTGTSPAAGAGRISYRLGLQGPSVIVDTACSSSLVAVHQACQALSSGDCDLALVGGVNVILTPVPMINFSRARMLAPDGRCKTFDASADGYVRGEGCGVVVLKRLPEAIADGDPIRAVIRGSAVNQDGASGGLTVPNGVAQQRVIATALRRAGVAGGDVDYLEAHGTGTSLGDPIEVHAAGEVFGVGRDPHRPLLIGSVKTNIGHLEAASGIAGIIKVALALEHETLPEHLHFTRPSPHIAWDRLSVRVVDESLPWKRNGRPRTAGVSSFGFSGTNAHVVLEEGPAVGESIDQPCAVGEPGPHVLPLSARTPEGLLALAARYREWLDANPDAALSDVCATARTGRAHFESRAALVVDSRARARRLLRALGDERPAPGLFQGTSAERPKTAWLFGGQGSQFVGMARELFEGEPVFADTVNRCAAAVEDVLARPLTSILFDTGAGAESALHDTAYAQPALFAVELGLARLWQSWGIEPDVVFGHSVGQYAAACVAGVFDLENGIRLVAERGRIIGKLPAGGRMAAIFAETDRVEERTADFPQISVAAYNGANTVVSGPAPDVEHLVATFADGGARTEWLDTSHAFHSALLEPALDEFESRAAEFAYAGPQIALICNRTGTVVTRRTPLDAQYWRRHARQPVRFADGVATLAGLGCGVVMDLGPQPVLTAAAMRIWPQSQTPPRTVASMRRDADSRRTFTEGLAAAYTAGHSLTSSVAQRRSHRVVDLPTYPFQHRDYWFDAYTGPELDRGARAGAARPSGRGARRSEPVAGGSEYRLETLLEVIRSELAAALRTPLADIDPNARFVALGMDSLIALDLCQRLHARLGAEVPAAMFFAHPTIAALADGLLDRVNARESGAVPPGRIPHVPWSGRAPLSHAQEQLWFLQQLLPSSSAYNVGARIDVSGPVDRESLRRSIETVVARHDALRTTFGSERGVPFAKVRPAFPAVEFELPFERLDEEDVAAAVAREAARPFDVEAGPLVRARLFELPGGHVLTLTMHHLITDGWSFGVLLRELALTYEALQRGLPAPLTELPIQYPDYAQWQRDRLSSPDYPARLEFWRTELDDAPTLELDTDRPRPKLPTFVGARKRFELGSGRAAALRELCC
ncbi:type I polyketide synthase, partial [Mycobacterium sp.]|uniref:type I polyketide synthase n=1 Tax=Mycobacterium sp. TaxID=1785 RepID=UPI002CAB8547